MSHRRNQRSADPYVKAKRAAREGLAGHETASRIRLYLDNAFEDALDLGLIDRNPVPAAKEAMLWHFSVDITNHSTRLYPRVLAVAE